MIKVYIFNKSNDISSLRFQKVLSVYRLWNTFYALHWDECVWRAFLTFADVFPLNAEDLFESVNIVPKRNTRSSAKSTKGSTLRRERGVPFIFTINVANADQFH